MTALWEKTMTDIEKGNAALESFIGEVADMVRDMISDELVIPSDIAEVHGINRQPRCLTDGCGGFLRWIEKPGKVSFFSCPLCHATFNDENGVPIPKKKPGKILESPCPNSCGRNARRYEGRYGYFWKCDCSPDITFKDVDGVPVPKEERAEAKCPVAGCKGRARRFTRKEGGYFWKCGVCGNFFDDTDGTPVTRVRKDGKKRK
jgi:DNA topoisomerase-3